MIDFSQFDSLIAMTMYFNNEEVCKNAIIETRWGVGEQQDVVCPYCGKHHCKMSKSGRFHCTACNHGALQFVCEDDGSVYTNNIEGFWSHFRRMISGCYHDVSDAHLQSYIDEAVFRWNTRKMAESERFCHMFHTSIGLVKPNREFVLCMAA